MRYIKEYKEFNYEKSIDVEDIKDILIDLEDNGFRTDVRKDNNGSYDIRIKIGRSSKSLRYVSSEQIQDYNFNTDEVKESINRVFDYIEEKEISIKKRIIVSPVNGTLFEVGFLPNNMDVEFIIVDIHILKNKKWWQVWKQKH